MLYTPMIKKAMALSFNAHLNQTDLSGTPYIYHPIHLAESMSTEDEIIVALLHDTLEDTTVTVNDLRSAGFSELIIDAVIVLTRDKSMPYLDYISIVKQNSLASIVKLADLSHNSDITRLNTIDEKSLARLAKYAKAIDILTKH